jgi:translation initiation factor IF-1
MKSIIRVLVIALTTLTFSGLSFAQAKPATPATPATPAAPATEKKTEMKSEKPKTVRMTGEVTSVDAKTGTLTVKAKDKETKLNAESSSAKKALEKVKVGDMVSVSYTEKDGKMVASSIAKTESKAKATKPEEKKSDMTEKKTEKR